MNDAQRKTAARFLLEEAMDVREVSLRGRPAWHCLYLDEEEVRRNFIGRTPGSYNTKVHLYSRACDELRGVLQEAAAIAEELSSELPGDGQFVTIEIGLSAGPAAPWEEVWRIVCNRFTAVAVMEAYVVSKALPYWCAGGEPAQLERIVWRV